MLTVALGSPQDSAAVTAPAYVPYSGSTFIKSTVLSAPQDATLTSSFHTFMATFADQKATPYPMINGLGSNKWGMPWAEGTCADPVWHLSADSIGVNAKWASLKTTGFHAPANLAFTGTSDSPFVVMDTCNGFTILGAGASVVGPNTVKVTKSAGGFWHTSNGLDAKNPLSNDTRNATSRGRIPDTMVIRRDAFSSALANNTSLGYALELFFVETDSTKGFTNPMVGAEGGKVGWGAEGWRIAVNPAINLDARTGCSAAGRVIAKTLQTYGGYLGDNSGSNTKIKAQQDNASGSVWAGSGLSQSSLNGCVTWNDFVVIKPGWQ